MNCLKVGHGGVIRAKRRWLVVAAVLGAVFPAAAQASVSGPMKIVSFARPAGSPCAAATGTSQTGITWDAGASQLLVSCWTSPMVDEISPTGVYLGSLEVDGLPGRGLGAIAWGGDRLWGCAINTGSTQAARARSNQLGYVQFINGVGSWVATGTAQHGCVNNVQVAPGGQLWADGAYKNSSGTSVWIDAGLAFGNLVGAFTPPFTRTGHVSGALPDALGQPLWEADNYSTVKSIWKMTANGPVEVVTGSLRFEQLACDPALGRVYVKWFNANKFGVIDGYGC
jgi:hypothetical protein